jgi:hypothetical protein
MGADRDVARFTTLLTACFVLLAAAASIAQHAGADTKDPVTGRWASDGLTYLDLKFDGSRTVSGTTIWRHGSTYEERAAIKTGTFDAKTGTLKLEGEGKRPDGVSAHYVIEGQIVNDTVTGTYQFGDAGGEFTFRRQ